MPEIGAKTVVMAIYDLHSKTGRWPTRDEIAAYLLCEIAVVKAHLLDLRRRRIMRDRVQRGVTRWMPWSEVR